MQAKEQMTNLVVVHAHWHFSKPSLTFILVTSSDLSFFFKKAKIFLINKQTNKQKTTEETTSYINKIYHLRPK